MNLKIDQEKPHDNKEDWSLSTTSQINEIIDCVFCLHADIDIVGSLYKPLTHSPSFGPGPRGVIHCRAVIELRIDLLLYAALALSPRRPLHTGARGVIVDMKGNRQATWLQSPVTGYKAHQNGPLTLSMCLAVVLEWFWR